MDRRKTTAIAISCGIACAICIALFLASVQGEAAAAHAEALSRYGGEQVEVCVATRDVPAGERVDSGAVTTKLWIADLLPEQAVRHSSEIVGKTIASPIYKGEVFTARRFERNENELSVPDGKVAISVPAKAVQAVGGALRQGMLVDVYASGDTSTTAIARNVVVLATSASDQNSLTGSSSWVTLAIDPSKVEEMVASSNRMELYFVLPGDKPTSSDQASSSASAASSSAASTTDAKSSTSTKAKKEVSS